MRTLEYRNAHVPAFLTKLWKLVTDPTSDDLISWNLGGTSFVIFDEIRFSKELLPMYFKHNNMASFVRQLNMYGFRKLSCIEQGGMHCIKNEIEFYHQYFIKGQESLLELIKRKIPSNKSYDDPKIKQEEINKLILNLKVLKGRQENAEEGMKHLKNENKLLWKQLSITNGRYLKQQAMLQQLLPFFMNMVQSSHRVALKRKSPLMIHEGESDEKVPCTTTPYFVEQHDTTDMSSSSTSSPGNVSNRGPVIHDVTELESSRMFADNILCSSNSSKENEVIIDSPLSSSLESSDLTVDRPFTNADSMEPLNILNCSFQSLSPVTPTEMSPVPRNIPVSSGLLTQEAANMTDLPPLSPIIGGMNAMTSPMPAPLHQACSPDAVHSSSSNSSYICQTPSHCGGQNMSVMDILSEVSNQSCSMQSDNFTSQNQPPTDYNWMLDTACGNEQNIESWLGQIFKTDNLSPGCSLPLRHGTNM